MNLKRIPKGAICQNVTESCSYRTDKVFDIMTKLFLICHILTIMPINQIQFLHLARSKLVD